MQVSATVGDVMHREFLGVSESDPLREAVDLMVAEGTDSLTVVRGGEPVGCLDSRAALSTVLSNGADGTSVGEVMRVAPPTVSPDDPLDTVTDRLVSDGVDRVVVTVDGEAVGIVTAHDVLAVGATRTTDPRRRSETTPSAAGMTHAVGSAPTADDGTADDVTGSETRDNDAYGASTQGVCEVCGSLAPSLTTTNGQAICADCQEV